MAAGSDAAQTTGNSGEISGSAEEARKLRKVVIATSAGTIFEAYDFILFGTLAPVIARHFFSGVNEAAAFIFALLTFAAGFAVRPLGALVFGSMGDRTGRKKAFLITITLMGGATFAIGLLPGYASIGIWAPALLIFFRMLQGLAYGGEYGGAVIYTAEHAPNNRRGLYVGWIQSAAGFALFMSFLVIFLTRQAVGDDNFEAWGWRIPFLISIVLLGFSVWIRMSLEESPLFRKMQAEGKASKKPLREAFGEWRSLKLVLLVLFGLMSLQGVLFYTSHFYSQFFLTQILKLPASTMTTIMMVVTFLSTGLYVFFSWLTDLVGRKKIILSGAILSLVTMVPFFHLLSEAANPKLMQAHEYAPVVVYSDPADCSLQFNPTGQAEFVTACDIARSTLADIGVGYTNEPLPGGTIAYIQVGETGRLASIDGSLLDPQDLPQVRAGFEQELRTLLAVVGYPTNADPADINEPLITLLIFLMIVFAVMVYGPMTTMALECFPTRVRYSALSLPYHIGSGWFGGFLPAIAFAMVAASGNLYFGLWYPMVVTAVAIVILAFFLPETRGRDLHKLD